VKMTRLCHQLVDKVAEAVLDSEASVPEIVRGTAYDRWEFCTIKTAQSIAEFLPDGAVQDFGICTYNLMRVCTQRHVDEKAEFNLIQYFTGANQGPDPLSEEEVRELAKGLGEPAYVFVPSNPKRYGSKANGDCFLWNIRVTKEVRGSFDSTEYGHIIGEDHLTLLRLWDNAAQQLAEDYRCARVITIGESMGGLGVVNQAMYQSNKTDVLVVIAGYGSGSSDERLNRGTSSHPAVVARSELQRERHENWLRKAENLKDVLLVAIIHCREDSVCSFLDQSLLCQEINRHGGNARLIEVPSHLATGKHDHQYFYASMIGPESWNVRRPIIDALAQDKPLARRAFEAMDDARKSLIDDVPRQRPQATNKKSLIEEPLRKRARTCVSSCCAESRQ